MDLGGLPPFQGRILGILRRLPPGRTIRYARLAAKAGRPQAARAAGSAMRANPLPLLIPCHRVLPASGGLGRYRPGKRWKAMLLQHEGIRPRP